MVRLWYFNFLSIIKSSNVVGVQTSVVAVGVLISPTLGTFVSLLDVWRFDLVVW